MSLRDQLLKAGLADKKQAKKAAKAAKKKQHEMSKAASNANLITPTQDDISDQINKQQMERKLKDLELNKKIIEEREQREQLYRASEIIVSRDLLSTKPNNEPYYFTAGGNEIKRIYVNDFQQSKLASGEYGIATTGKDQFYLLCKEDCEQVKQVHSKFLVCMHDLELEA